MQMESLINAGLVKNDLRRFWPLWLVYIIALGLLVVAPLYAVMLAQVGEAGAAGYDAEFMGMLWGAARFACMPFAFTAALIVAVSLNGRLFNPVAATFFGAVPLRRRTLFSSSFVTGLVPLVCVPALAALAMLPLHASFPGQITLVAIGQWFVLLVAASFVMYAIALVSCQLAGTWPVAVLLYVVLSYLAVCVEGAVRLVIMSLVYGQMGWDLVFDWASAPYYLTVFGIGFDGSAGVNWPVLIAYCAAAVVLVIVAGFLHARRPMESAGESVAFQQLRPVLKYAAGVSMALLFAGIACLYRFLAGDTSYGMPAGSGYAFVLFACMAIGGLIGLVLAEAVMRKSTQQVLKRSWKGALVLALVAAVFVVGVSTDALGLVNRIPDASKVAIAEMRIDGQDAVSFSASEGIEAVRSLNQDVIARGAMRDGDESQSSQISFIYTQENGKVFERTYAVYYPVDDNGNRLRDTEGSQLIERVLALANSKDGKESRYADMLDVSKDNPYVFTVEYYYDDAGSFNVQIPANCEASFVEEGLKPDLLGGKAGDIREPWGWESNGEALNVVVEVTDSEGVYRHGIWLDTEETPHIIAWLKANYPEIDEKAWQPAA